MLGPLRNQHYVANACHHTYTPSPSLYLSSQSFFVYGGSEPCAAPDSSSSPEKVGRTSQKKTNFRATSNKHQPLQRETSIIYRAVIPENDML